MCVMSVLIDKTGNICDLFQAESVELYVRQETWKLSQKDALESIQKQGRQEVTTLANELVAILSQADCNCLIGTKIIGIAYQILDRNGILLCETDEKSVLVMEEIYRDFYITKTKEEIKQVPPYPVKISEEGFYYFDFDLAMKCHSTLSSKKMLIPFLKESFFTCLTIRCSHVMPWLDTFIEESGMSIDLKREEGIYTVNITHGGCLS